MLSHVDRYRISAIEVGRASVTCIIVAFVVLCFSNLRIIGAQSQPPSLRDLFLRVVEMRQANSDFVFGVEFVAPLGADEVWLIGSANDELRRSIDEVGSDYVCFREHHDAFQLVRCTPFVNVAEISYMDE
ncbi:MAG: hypothetical protein IT320_18635 [Anaerolineae bacterium]|nr:hypothetical protein [Anaerolineae bacterium]